MSTKGTIFLTKDNEHCYCETLEEDNGQYRIYLEIDSKNITELNYEGDRGVTIGIKGDSDMAKCIRSAKYQGVVS